MFLLHKLYLTVKIDICPVKCLFVIAAVSFLLWSFTYNLHVTIKHTNDFLLFVLKGPLHTKVFNSLSTNNDWEKNNVVGT